MNLFAIQPGDSGEVQHPDTCGSFSMGKPSKTQLWKGAMKQCHTEERSHRATWGSDTDFRPASHRPLASDTIRGLHEGLPSQGGWPGGRAAPGRDDRTCRAPGHGAGSSGAVRPLEPWRDREGTRNAEADGGGSRKKTLETCRDIWGETYLC